MRKFAAEWVAGMRLGKTEREKRLWRWYWVVLIAGTFLNGGSIALCTSRGHSDGLLAAAIWTPLILLTTVVLSPAGFRIRFASYFCLDWIFGFLTLWMIVPRWYPGQHHPWLALLVIASFALQVADARRRVS